MFPIPHKIRKQKNNQNNIGFGVVATGREGISSMKSDSLALCLCAVSVGELIDCFSGDIVVEVIVCPNVRVFGVNTIKNIKCLRTNCVLAQSLCHYECLSVLVGKYNVVFK